MMTIDNEYELGQTVYRPVQFYKNGKTIAEPVAFTIDKITVSKDDNGKVRLSYHCYRYSKYGGSWSTVGRICATEAEAQILADKFNKKVEKYNKN